MPNCPLFASWTWKLPIPDPFDKLTSYINSTIQSIYNDMPLPKSTLHGPILKAILAYMAMDTTIAPSTSLNAIGTQGEKIISEYQSSSGKIIVSVFNQKNGKFNVGTFENAGDTPKVYALKSSENTGTALFFTLLPKALSDSEFRESYDSLVKHKNSGFPDMDAAASDAFILCDNLYRRIENPAKWGDAGIELAIPKTGNLPQLTQLNLNKGAYSPSSALYGIFRILTTSRKSSVMDSIDKKDFLSNFKLSPTRNFTPEEKLQIPAIEDWYEIPPEVVTICKHASLSSNSNQPMRNFMLRGPAGTGKTEGAKAIAAGLGLPYVYYTCSANTEVYDFLGQMLPETDNKHTLKDYPTLEDIQMDAATAYHKLTGFYDEDVTEDLVYQKLIETISMDSTTALENGGQKFHYVETPLIKAIRNGYVIEIQEPTVIANPGVLVGLNALLDRCASVTLTTGEVVTRHPDTVIVITTNINYAGCRSMNQSIISRMNLILDIDELELDTLVDRAIKVTGCTNRNAVIEMANSLREINQHCKETMINDGSCGVRELICWVQSFMIVGSISEAATYTVLSSATSEPESREEIRTLIEQKIAV